MLSPMPAPSPTAADHHAVPVNEVISLLESDERDGLAQPVAALRLGREQQRRD